MSKFSLYDLRFFDGADLVVVMVSYFDASEIGDHLAIGGLLFRKKFIKPFEKKWRVMLNKYGLSHFHMTDCNVQEGEYKGKSEEECDDCAREAIALILKYAAKGIIFRVKKSDFHEIVGTKGVMPNPFTLGVWFSLFELRRWSDDNDPNARIAYVFESGDDHQRDAEHLLSGIREQAARAEAFRYNGHAFLPKAASIPTQAADILAWHGAKQADRYDRGIDRLRGDFVAIVDNLSVTDGHHNRERLQTLVEITERLTSDEIIPGFRVKAEHKGEFAQISFLLNQSNLSQYHSKARHLLEPIEAVD